jgi:hypothetical protein
MSDSLHQATVPVYDQLLSALSTVIDKAIAHAEARKIDPAVLAAARLYPDMYPFWRQVQLACDHAKFGAGRLAGGEMPKFDDNLSTFEELKARIAATLDYIRGVDGAAINAGADRDITIPVGPTRKLHFKGRDFLFHFSLPNFYFHAATAYDILRHNGVEIGKRDFIGAAPRATLTGG